MPNPPVGEHFFVSFDKTPIHYYLHPSSQPKGSVLIVHGAGEHAGRYADFAQFLAQNGFTAAAIDLRGYGKSGGTRAFAKSFSEYGRDIDALMNKLRKDSPLPAFLFGHSMGGLIAARAAAYDLQTPPAGVALSSPCFGLAFQIPEALRFFGRVMSFIRPRYMHRTLVMAETLTHDPARIESHRNDPLIYHYMTARLFELLDREMMSSAITAQKLKCPVLISQAGDDRIVNLNESRKFYENLASADKEFKVYLGFFHEILNETDRQTVYQDLLAWFQKHV